MFLKRKLKINPHLAETFGCLGVESAGVGVGVAGGLAENLDNEGNDSVRISYRIRLQINSPPCDLCRRERQRRARD